jgi:hypothetical protein
MWNAERPASRRAFGNGKSVWPRKQPNSTNWPLQLPSLSCLCSAHPPSNSLSSSIPVLLDRTWLFVSRSPIDACHRNLPASCGWSTTVPKPHSRSPRFRDRSTPSLSSTAFTSTILPRAEQAKLRKPFVVRPYTWLLRNSSR